jgi:hypothetical protein
LSIGKSSKNPIFLDPLGITLAVMMIPKAILEERRERGQVIMRKKTDLSIEKLLW